MAGFDLDKKVKRLNGNIIYRLIMLYEHYIGARSMNFLLMKAVRWTIVIIFRLMPQRYRLCRPTGPVTNVGAKKLYGIVFHVSPEGVMHKDVLNNLFAPTLVMGQNYSLFIKTFFQNVFPSQPHIWRSGLANSI